METVVLYLLKACLLLTVFYIAYYFLLRKETFYNGNRWFLLTGLVASLLLPLAFITKTVWIEPQNIVYDNNVNPITYVTATPLPDPVDTSVDWITVGLYIYGVIVLTLIARLCFNMVSLFSLFRNKKTQTVESVVIIDTPDNQAPFSFFNFIVINSSLYSREELENIIHHEMVHSKQKHTFDVLIAHIFCILFWYHPIVWLYKKAIQHNLEFIADSLAVQATNNPVIYQKALVKVIACQNKLSITNHFNQSLIKKRIVMLNRNQSKKRNAIKYFLIIPLLFAFFIAFQVKTIAQERWSPKTINKSLDKIQLQLEITSKTTDAELKKEKEQFKNVLNTDVKFSKIKRNKQGELTSIKVDVNSGKEVSKSYHFSSSEPIKPFTIIAKKDNNGLVTITDVPGTKKQVKTLSINSPGIAYSYGRELNPEELAAMAVVSADSQVSSSPSKFENIVKNTDLKISKGKDGKTTIIANGKVIFDEKMDINIDFDKIIDDVQKTLGTENINIDFQSLLADDAKIDKEKLKRSAKEAVAKAKVAITQMQPEIEKSHLEIEQSKKEIELAKKEIELAKKEIEKAKKEIEMAKLEIQNAKKENKK